jgi:hypothetical protein
MNNQKRPTDSPIELDATQLLGLSQVTRVTAVPASIDELGRTMSKVGGIEDTAPRACRLLSKVGFVEGE